jgi:hypothetical protein
LIDEYALAVLFQDQVVGCGLIQLDVILKARTSSAFDSHAQGLGLAGKGRYFGQTVKGAVSDARG